MDNLEKIARLTGNDRELFTRSLRTLFSSSFLIRGVDRDRDMYRFVTSNRDMVEAYFEYAGFRLRVDESLGVVSWEGAPSIRLGLNLDETLALLTLRLMYEKKRNEIQLHRHPVIQQYEFQEDFQVITGKTLKKTRIREVLRRMQALRLINLRGEETSPDTQIELYSSIPFALNSVTIDELYERINALTGADDDTIEPEDEETIMLNEDE
ncbi:MAG: DUF4194 domain-containing protein [Spirochaetota bacterium]